MPTKTYSNKSASSINFISLRNHINSAWLSIGSVLTTATQLRLETMPFGPGEFILLAWAVWTSFSSFMIDRTTPKISRNMVGFLRFWCISALCLAAGSLTAHLVGKAADDASALHDSGAFAFLVFILLSYSLCREVSTDPVCMARWLVSLVVISFVCMLILAYSTESIGNIRFHYAVTRFTGWAKNPNQLALLLAPIPFIAADLGLRAKGANSAGWWAAATFIVMGGTATQSDALVVAWGSTVFFMAILILFFSARRGRRNSRWVVLGCILVLLIPIIAFLVESILNLELISLLYNSIRSLYEQNEQGHIRIILWENGMKAILSSPLVGLGPGSHSGLVGPYGGSEAHNSLIDWGASAGFLGIAAYLTLMASMFLAAIRRQRTMLALALYSLFIFSLFHYVLRHPFFWLTLATVRLLIEMPSNGIKGMRKNVRVKRFLAATPYKPQSSISHLL